MDKSVKVVYRDPPPFPGFDPIDDGEDQDSVEDKGEGAAGDDTKGAEASTPNQQQGAESEVYALSEPAEIDDEQLIVDPATGQPRPWKEIKAERLLHADYTRKSQALGRYRNIVELYEKSPKFRQGVDMLGAEILGLNIPGATPPQPAVPDEEWAEKFDRGGKDARELLRREIGEAVQETSQRLAAEVAQAEHRSVVKAMWAVLAGQLGDDYEAVYDRVAQKAEALASTDPVKYNEINTDPKKLARFVHEEHRALVASREAALNKANDKGGDAARAAVAAGGTGGETDAAKTKPAGYWSRSPEKFRDIVRRVKGL